MNASNSVAAVATRFRMDLETARAALTRASQRLCDLTKPSRLVEVRNRWITQEGSLPPAIGAPRTAACLDIGSCRRPLQAGAPALASSP